VRILLTDSTGPVRPPGLTSLSSLVSQFP